MSKTLALSVLVVAALALVAINCRSLFTCEGFATKMEKADAIVKWFSNHPKPQYTEYRDDLNKQSNIVEYEDALRLQSASRLTPANMASVL